jgi:hypothetical protein
MSRPWSATGVVEAPVHAVFAALLAVGPTTGAHHHPADNTTRGDPNGVLRYQASIGERAYTVTVEVDQTSHTLAVQGHWWYRGVYSVRECARGSLVEYHVHNVATHGRWVVPLMQRRLSHRISRDLADLLQNIGKHLDRPAYPSPDGNNDAANH